MTPLPLLLLLASPARATCPLHSRQLGERSQAAIEAWKAWKDEDFASRYAGVTADLACLDEPVTSQDAQVWHVATALAAATRKDHEAIVSALAAVVALDPTWQPPSDLAAQGSEMQKAYFEARSRTFPTLRPLPPGVWFVDGKVGVGTLPGRDALVQLVDPSGRVETWVSLGKGPPPELLARLTPKPEPTAASSAPTSAGARVPPPAQAPPAGHGSRTLAIAGGASAACALGSYLLARSFEGAFWEENDPTTAKFDYHATNVAGGGALAFGLVAGGLFAGAIVKGEW